MPPRKASAPRADVRETLLERAVSHVARHGFADASLRAIAPVIGTSHRMLVYHFGSADAFWSAVMAGLRRRERDALAQAAALGRLPALTKTWAGLAAPKNLPRMKLLFQMYGRAFSEPDRFESFLEHAVSDWLETSGVALQTQHGLAPAQARMHARLRLAVMRGLVLDLLTTGDRAGTTAALRFFAAHERIEPQRRAKRVTRGARRGTATKKRAGT